MGNSQSTAAEGQKIAKPQNVGSTLRASKSFSPSTQSVCLSPHSNSEDARASKSPSLLASPATDSPRDDSLQHRNSFLGSPALDGPGGPSLKPSQIDLLAASVARSLSRSGSRKANIVSPRSSMGRLKGGAQLSVTAENTVDLQSAIAIIEELRKTASPEDLAALQKALLPAPSRDSLKHTGSPDPQDEVDPAMAALIRRKSFAQPGVATRHVKSERNLLRKPVPAPLAKSSPWTKDMMGASPLARLSSLDAAPKAAALEPPQETLEHRAPSPSDLDYTQLGNLKHGSLMVVNGPPSPNPSVATHGHVARKPSDDNDDYFTASEREDSRPNSRRAEDSTPEATEWNNKSPFEAQSRGRGNQVENLTKRRDGSPLKQELRESSPVMAAETAAETAVEMDGEMDAASIYSRHVRPTHSTLSLQSPPTRRFSFDESSGDELQKTARKPQSQSAISLASEYMSEMPPSPYKKAFEQRDDVPVEFLEDIDYNIQPESNTQHPSIHEQHIMMPPSIPQDAPPISPRKPLRSNPTLEDEEPTVTSMRPKRPVGVKMDSGYSSANTSVVEAMSPSKMHPHHSWSPVEPMPPVKWQPQQYQPPVEIPVTKVASQQQHKMSPVEPPVPQTKTQQRFYKSPGAVDLAIRIGRIDSHHATPEPDPDAEPGIVESIEKDEMKDKEKIKRSKSWRKSVRKSLPRLMSTESTATTDTRATSASATSSSEQKPKKLQKRRPLSQPPISMGDRHILDKSIPRVPSTVFSRYSYRLSASPAMQHLDETYENANDSRDSSVGPDSSTSKPNVSSCFFPDAKMDEEEAPPAHRLSFRRPGFRRSRTQFDEHEVMSAGIADFGTVSQSLGTSPYDAAYTGPRHSTSAGATQPHHLSTKAPRNGPREGWDAETASRIAQARSRERAAAAQQHAWEQRGYSERRPAIQRPLSYHDDMPARTSHPPQQNRSSQRPQSMHAHAAPNAPGHFNHGHDSRSPHGLPSLPAHQTRPRTAHPDQHHGPVQRLVSEIEHKASVTQAPPPMPSADWSASARVWRERRMNAQTQQVVTTTTSTPSPPPPQQKQQPRTTTTRMSTTTTTTVMSGAPHMTTTTTTVSTPRPQLQNFKSMPQMRDSHPPATQYNAPAQYGNYQNNGSSNRHHPMDGSRYATGMGRDVAPTASGATRRLYGLDFGDVPVRVI